MFGFSMFDLINIYLFGLYYISIVSTTFWVTVELWTIGSFFWAYIDDCKWQLPKPIESIMKIFYCKIMVFQGHPLENIFDYGIDRVIKNINDEDWFGDGWDYRGGRAWFVSLGFIGRVLLGWLIGLLWLVIVAIAAFWVSLRSLRFLRRTQKTVTKIAKNTRKHGIDSVELISTDELKF